jgi:hypothetical protein
LPAGEGAESVLEPTAPAPLDKLCAMNVLCLIPSSVTLRLLLKLHCNAYFNVILVIITLLYSFKMLFD